MAQCAAWSIESIAALARNAAPESIRLNILRAKLKSAVPVFRDQSVKPSAPIMNEKPTIQSI